MSAALVAGNHDVGDKPDPTMPASWVTADFLADYHARFGRSWYSWRQGELSFIALNSQIMNSALPEAAAQQTWLENELPQHDGQRIFLFLHLPPFLHDEHEPDLGHYDNLAEPARLAAKPGSAIALSGFLPPTFTGRFTIKLAIRAIKPCLRSPLRPGFSELFSSAPPAEQGRDDVAKLGFFLVRVHEHESCGPFHPYQRPDRITAAPAA
ncbi:MAG: hypothetical protein R2911_18880 [Caldilineaceae bacterium]